MAMTRADDPARPTLRGVRRWSPLLLGAAAGALALAVISPRAPLDYAPLVLGSATARPAGFTRVQETSFEQRQDVLMGEYAPGTDVDYGYSIRNGGSLPIHVVGVRFPSPCGMLCQTEVRLQEKRESYGADREHTVPFHAFDLDPGEEAWIAIFARMAGCDAFPEHSYWVHGAELIDFTADGVRHAQKFALPMYFQIVAPGQDRCAAASASGSP
jgi:hypothetical protein